MRMRVATDHHVITADPGATIEVPVDVVNTGDLIDGVTARLVGLDGATVRTEPAVLPLFPGSTGRITLSVDLPTSQPAGLHPVTVEVVSHVSGTTTQHLDLDLSVSAQPGVRLSRQPAVIRSRRAAKFVLAVENTGNVALDVNLGATSPERVTTRFSPTNLRVEPGALTPVMLTVKGPRMITGTDIDRPVTVDLVGRRVNTIPAMDEAESEPELKDEAVVTLKQRPIISRGLLTALILAAIVALWAAVFLLGLTQVFKGDPMTKTAPASYFPASVAEGLAPGSKAAAAANAKPPAGATPKTGLMPPGVGGQITGVVTARSNDGPVGRILVQAYRIGRNGPQLVSSAATQSDGSYVLAGLFPTTYYLKFSADGFTTQWWPSQPGGGSKTTSAVYVDGRRHRDSVRLAAATTGIEVKAQGKVGGANVVVKGHDAQVSGSVDPGDSTSPVTTTVTARLLDGGKVGAPTTTLTDANDHYVVTGLKAPGTYELSFTTPGYQVTTETVTVTGGEQQLEPTVVLSAQSGILTGTVTDPSGRPLGGVTVSTTVNGQAVSVITPTVGSVGSYTFDNLPTPGTYVVTFTAKGDGTATRIVDLKAGTNGVADAKLAPGTGSVTGVLCLPSSGASAAGGCPSGTVGAGGATVTVGGTSDTAAIPATTTLTSGTVGAFSVSGLSSPGAYTLTFSLPGYRSETVPVNLTAGAPANVTALLQTELVRVCGTVTVSGATAPFVGANVVLTDGPQSWTTKSADSAPGGGVCPTSGYLFPNVPAGTYSVTVSASGYQQETAQIVVGTADVEQDLRLTAGGS